jgi:hypothetical protein
MHIGSDGGDRGLAYKCRIASKRQRYFVRHREATDIGKSLACFCLQVELLLDKPLAEILEPNLNEYRDMTHSAAV